MCVHAIRVGARTRPCTDASAAPYVRGRGEGWETWGDASAIQRESKDYADAYTDDAHTSREREARVHQRAAVGESLLHREQKLWERRRGGAINESVSTALGLVPPSPPHTHSLPPSVCPPPFLYSSLLNRLPQTHQHLLGML